MTQKLTEAPPLHRYKRDGALYICERDLQGIENTAGALCLVPAHSWDHLDGHIFSERAHRIQYFTC